MAKTKQTQTKILFAHSAGAQYRKGKGSYDLVKYLKSKLSGEFKILFPIVEKPNSPTYSTYKKIFKAEFAKISEPFILIGHSLGGSVLLKYLSEEQPAASILGLFLVSTPHWKSNMKEFELKKNFQASIKDIPAIFLYHSKNDPIVSFEDMNFYKDVFSTAIIRELPGKEHIFSNGLPKLVSDIKQLAKEKSIRE
jgi:uncharacterized protein